MRVLFGPAATAACLSICFAAVPTRAWAIDLLEAYRHTLMHSAKFAAARAAYEAQREKAPQGLAQLLPTVGLNGNATKYDAEIEYEPNTSFQSGARRYDNNQYELSLTQPLFRVQNFATYRQGQAQADHAEAQFAWARLELMVTVTEVYLKLLSAHDDVEVAEAQKSAFEKQLVEMRARLAAGAAAITEVHEAKARTDNATAQLISAQATLDSQKRQFWKTTGLEPTIVARLMDNMPLLPPEPQDLNKWIALSMERSPLLQASRDNLRSAQFEVDKAKGGHYPNLDIVAGYARGNSTGSVYTSAGSDTNWTNYGLQLQFPLFQGGAVNSRVREAAANRDRTREEGEDLRRDVILRVEQNYLAVLSKIAEVQARAQAVLSNESAVEAITVGRRVGTRNLTDLLDATQRLYIAKRDFSRSRYDYLLSHLWLRAYAGTLTEEDLNRANRLLAHQ